MAHQTTNLRVRSSNLLGCATVQNMLSTDLRKACHPGSPKPERVAMLSSFAFTRIDRYILRQLLVALTLVTSCLVALIWLTQSLRFIQIIVSHGLSPFVFIKLTMLLVPSFVAIILPITCFIVVLFIYARLNGDRELTVMRATGLSDVALARPALILALGATLACYILNLFIVPASLSAFRDYEFEIRSQMAAFLLEPGVFTRVADHVTVYVQSRSNNDDLSGILIQDGRDPSSPVTILAHTGQIQVTKTGPQVVLEDGSQQHVDAKTGQLDILNFKSDTMSLTQSQKSGSAEATDSSQVSLGELFHPPLKLTEVERAKWLVEAQRRLTAPLSAISFTLIGLIATLTGIFRRHGGFVRPAGSVLAVTLLVALGLGVNNMAARNLAVVPLIWVMAVMPLVGAAGYLFMPRVPQR